jgi:transcriptional regulator with XRE-family HTH domain
VDDIRLGGVVRALRIRRGWTQAELARAARVSPSTVSRIERGRIDRMDLAVLRRVFAALDARIDLVPRWHGGELDRLLDARHAGMIERLVRRLSQLPDWIVHPEVTFSIYGERGAIDIVAWHPGRRALLIIEVKTALGDVGGLVRQVDRYRRLARDIAKERGWVAASVAVWVVVADGRTARRRLAEHRATLRRAFPADGHAMEGWLRAPRGDLSGLSFLPIGHPLGAGRARAVTA